MTRRFEVPCTIEIEESLESLHAHVSLDGIEPEPGDAVIVHGAPAGVPFGERRVFAARATLIRATPFQRFWARVEGYLELTELYEVGFSAGRVA